MAKTLPTAIAVDLGGTKTAAALVSSQGEILGKIITERTPSSIGGEAILDVIASVVTQQYAALSETPAAIGIGAAGSIDAERGVVVNSSGTIVNWIGTDIVSGLRARLDWAQEIPIKVQNDADAHALGESWQGAGRGAQSMLMVAVGTGIGCAFCVNGAVLHGAHHIGGEIGTARIPFHDGGPVVTDGALPGKFEQNSAGPAMLRFYRELGGAASASNPRGQFVMELAENGDPVAVRVTQILGARLGEVLSWYVMMLDPEVIVLGGGVPKPQSAWWEAMEKRLLELLPEYMRNKVELRRASLKSNAALLGAALDAFRLAGIETY
ncbi:MAG: ROK family protein [Arcanobacterium sp.]|nr:ROK family protein [Arcanobacterium sp.]MDY5589880.1 ROK family protein [Arcanobacterium sp.]